MFMYDGLELSKTFQRLKEMMNKNYWKKLLPTILQEKMSLWMMRG